MVASKAGQKAALSAVWSAGGLVALTAAWLVVTRVEKMVARSAVETAGWKAGLWAAVKVEQKVA